MFVRQNHIAFSPADSGRSIDDDILDMMPDLKDGQDDGDTNDTGDDDASQQSERGDNGAQEQGTEQAPRNTQTTQTDKGQQGVGKGGPGKQEPVKKVTPNPGDLIDRKTGSVIAKAGAERRYYEQSHRERIRANTAEQKVNELQTRLTAFEQSNSVGTQLGLSPEQVTTGARLVKDWITNPVDMINKLITVARQQGHNIEGLGQGVDTAAIKNMIAEHLKPFTEAHTQSREAQQARTEAQTVWTNFTAVNPDAELHVTALNHILANDPNISLDGAYYKLQAFYYQRGLDWNKPLEQIAREAEQEEQGTGQRQQPNGRAISVPNGRGAHRNVSDNDDVSAAANASLDEIIKSAMTDAGIH